MPLHAQHTNIYLKLVSSQDQAFKLEMHQVQDVKSVATDSKASAALEMTGVVTEGSRLSWEEEVKVGRSVRD